MKKKKCKECKEPFEPSRQLQYLCSPLCAINMAKRKLQEKLKKQANEESRQRKVASMKHSDWIQALQVVFNRYIRKRDDGKGCISCGTRVAEEYHAGHYIPTTKQYCRFNEMNVHLQCSWCNTRLRGNLTSYRENLVLIYGEEKVLELEQSRHNNLMLSIPEIKELILIYKNKYNELIRSSRS